MRPKETEKEFSKDGWFVTGDSASYDKTIGSFKILGRNSSDIIKSKGYKISALELETKLLENQLIEDCAIIGLSDAVIGQKIIALVVLRKFNILMDKCKNLGSQENAEHLLKTWCEENFATYCVPTIKIVKELPRNQMGKINKIELMKNFII